jgi:hypothetical protein
VWGWLLALAALTPGRYAGSAPDWGRVWIELLPDGTATWDGVVGRWQGTSLQVGDRTYRWVEGCLEGPGGPVCLRLVAPPERPRPVLRPAAWVGRWRHSASGGSLVLVLQADGRVLMAGAEGRWRSEGDQLVLVFSGRAVRYRVARVGPGLRVAGGDLPFGVVFSPVDDAPVEAEGASTL